MDVIPLSRWEFSTLTNKSLEKSHSSEWAKLKDVQFKWSGVQPWPPELETSSDTLLRSKTEMLEQLVHGEHTPAVALNSAQLIAWFPWAPSKLSMVTNLVIWSKLKSMPKMMLEMVLTRSSRTISMSEQFPELLTPPPFSTLRVAP